MTKIFLSYRREDASGYAGRLTNELGARFGRQNVFRDVDSVVPGSDFILAIHEAIGACDAVVALIGRNWLYAVGLDGRRRLDDPADVMRIELVTALERGVRVVPVLVDRAAMPPAESLPPALAPLARRHALEISEGRWDYDVERLINVLDPSSPETLSGAVPVVVPRTDPKFAPGATPEPPPRRRRRILTAIGGVVVLVSALLALLISDRGEKPILAAGRPTTTIATSITTVPSSPPVATGCDIEIDAVTSGGADSTTGAGSPGQSSPGLPGGGNVGPVTPTPEPPSTVATTPTPEVTEPTSPVTSATPNADAVAGSWSGTAYDDGVPFTITLDVRAGCGTGQTCGTVYVSNNNCTGDWAFYGRSNDAFEFVVKNFTATSNPACEEGRGYYLTPEGDTLAFTNQFGPFGTLHRS